MKTTIMIRQDQNKYRVFDGDLQLACFSNKTAAEDFSKQITRQAK